MAINATPEYEKAEQRYRAATSPAEELAALEEMLRLVPKHKSSEKLQAQLKSKIAALRKGGGERSAASHADPYHVPPGGAGQVAVIGMPNTGKSALVEAVTEAKVKVADFPFATAVPAPGMWLWEDAQIQLVDTPPMTAEHVEGGLVNLIRNAEVVLLVADAASPESLDQVDVPLGLLADRQISLHDCPAAQVGDTDSPWPKPGLIALTHADQVADEEINTFAEMIESSLTICPVDCLTRAGFDDLARHLWRLLHVVRVFTRRPGEKAPLSEPFTLPVGSTVEDLARFIHRDLPDKIKFARIWGQDRHSGQQVHRTETLHDRDIVELHE